MAEIFYYKKREREITDKQNLTFFPLGITLVDNRVGI